jgi:hypothetical protein
MGTESSAPAYFAELVASVSAIEWPEGLDVHPIDAPTGLAPSALAFAADVTAGPGKHDRGTGRLIFLDDPSEPTGWGGRGRVIIFAQSPIEALMGGHDELAHVAWSWLTESLMLAGASYEHPSATVTRVVSVGFGDLASQGRGSQIEVRASWSPTSSDGRPHAEAWARFVLHLAGFEILPDGVVAMGV